MSKTKVKTTTNAAVLRFDPTTLAEAAGSKAFARGQAYFLDGRVEILAIESERVRARIAGTEIYRTNLQGSGQRFSGECSCPVFSDRSEFCKHMVAVALAVNDMKPSAPAVPNRFTQIRDHLRARSREALVELILEFAERDPALLRELELSAALDGKDDEALYSCLKAAITEATRTSSFIAYRQMPAWASNVEATLVHVGALAGRGRAALALRLLDHFFDRMAQALQSVDDSNGHGGALLALASEMHLEACRIAKPAPVALARELFRREAEGEWDCFHGASQTYEALLGKAGLAEYRRLAEEAWKEIKPLQGGARKVRDDQFILRHRLQSILEGFAARDGNIDTMIAVRTRDLSSAYQYLLVAELCLEHGRLAEASKWAEEGLWQFEDDPDERLVAFAARLRRRLPKVSSGP